MDRPSRRLGPRRLLLLGGATFTVLLLLPLYRLARLGTGFEAGRPAAPAVVGPAGERGWAGPPSRGAAEELPPHRYEHADDFLPLIRRLPGMPNLTLPAAAAACDWSDTELMQYPYGRGEHYIASPPAESEVDLMRSQWQRFLREGLLPYNATSAAPLAGRGIVVVGGRPQTLKRASVLIRSLRRLGSKVPVELHYWGAEMDVATKKALYEQFGYELFSLNDLAAPHNLYFSRRPYNDVTQLNYQLKTAALLNSRFAEPLLMDADNVPVRDPAALWDSATYRAYGTVFWPDIQRSHRENPAYAATNAPCRRDDYELESGQLLVDKRRFFYHLQLADWFMAQPAFARLLLGDKDTFRFAWAALRTRHGRPRKWVTSVGAMLPRPPAADAADDADAAAAAPVFDYCGHSFAQHHPDTGDVAFVHGGALKTYGGPLLRRLRAAPGGGAVFRHYKRSALDEDWARVEYGVQVRWLNATYMYAHMPAAAAAAAALPAPAPLPPGQTEALVFCVDFKNVPARDFRDLLPDFEASFEAAGGLWMVDAEYRAGVHDPAGGEGPPAFAP